MASVILGQGATELIGQRFAELDVNKEGGGRQALNGAAAPKSDALATAERSDQETQRTRKREEAPTLLKRSTSLDSSPKERTQIATPTAATV